MSDKQDDEAQAQNIAYTINHALACTATDFIDPFVGNWTQKILGTKISIGCGHDHGHGHHDHEPHHHEACDHEHAAGHSYKGHLNQWMIAELAGDFGAVPVTVALQKYAPSFMQGVQGMMEPALGGFFRSGAYRAAKKWADANGISYDSAQFKEHEAALYDYEVSHLPQALLWTVSSITINMVTHRALGNEAPITHLLAGKALGASVSAGLVVGARGVLPEQARKWDAFSSKNLFLPATKWVGRLFGVNAHAVDKMAAEEAGRKV